MTQPVRCQIDSLLQAELSIADVSRRLGYNKTSVYRYLSRNSSGNKYFPHQATIKYMLLQRQQGQNFKVIDRLEGLVEDKLFVGWSPEQISGRLRCDKVASVSHETIYQYIHRNPELRTCLRKTRRRGHGRYFQRKQKWRNKLHISKHPEIAINRGRIGD